MARVKSTVYTLLSISAAILAERRPAHIPTDGASWYGNDGTWSGATLRLGNPAQYVSVLVSTSASETWVVSSVFCNLPGSKPYNCADRGRPFNASRSSSWRGFGRYGLEARVGQEVIAVPVAAAEDIPDYGYGDFGLDTIAVNEGSEDGNFTFYNQVLATVDDTTHLLGTIGLGVGSRSFENDTTYASLVSTAYEDGLIPSRSFGYTAGMFYRPEKVPMDLVLGGTNPGRYLANNLSFDLDADSLPSVELQAISVDAIGLPLWGSGPETLLNEPIAVVIDSTYPYLTLPQTVCRKFESTLGLTWDRQSELYLINDTTSDSLTALNLTFTFILSDVSSNAKQISIEVPYGAFELVIAEPFVNGTRKRYFPLKQGQEDQFTLGRAFLQDAYLAVDYDRKNFSLSQARYPPEATEMAVIYAPGEEPGASSTPQSSSSKALSNGALAGVVIGAVAVVVIVIAVWLISRRQKPEPQSPEEPVKKEEDNTHPNEMPAAEERNELGASSSDPVEMAVPERNELGASSPDPVEMAVPERHELAAVNVQHAELSP